MKQPWVLPVLLAFPIAACSMFGGGGNQYSQVSRPAPNEQVRQAQQKLADMGIYHGTVDGIAGPDTHSAISQYQQQNGLTPNGMLDQQTDQELLAQGNASGSGTNGAMANNQASSAQANTGQSSPASPQPGAADRVRQAQQRLADMGLYHANVDGMDGPRTRAAIRQFQQQHGLNANGRLDQRTDQALMTAQANPPNSNAAGATPNNPANNNPSLGSNPMPNNGQGSTAPGSGSSAGAGPGASTSH